MLSQVSLCPRGRGWVGISGLMSFPGVGISGTRSLPGVGMSEGGGYVRGGGIHTSGLGWDFRIMVTPPSRHGTSGIQRDTFGKRAVRILLECFLVGLLFSQY